MYRAAIGLFISISGRRHQKLNFLTKATVIPFLCLVYAKEKQQVALSVLSYIISVYSIIDIVSAIRKHKYQTNNKQSSPTDPTLSLSLIHI